MNVETICKKLREKNCRVTSLRKMLLEHLLQVKEPISVKVLLKELNKRGVHPNQSTLYRQLETLVNHEIIDAVVINAKVQLFELRKDHHHHFVCGGCDDVQDIHSEEIETAFHTFQQTLSLKGLKIKKHELTFFGECQACH
jgi:Fur family peroxide stress response transcriptional regulator